MNTIVFMKRLWVNLKLIWERKMLPCTQNYTKQNTYFYKKIKLINLFFLVKYFLSFNFVLWENDFEYTNERNETMMADQYFWRWVISNIRSHSICYNARLMIELLINLMPTKTLIINIYFFSSAGQVLYSQRCNEDKIFICPPTGLCMSSLFTESSL